MARLPCTAANQKISGMPKPSDPYMILLVGAISRSVEKRLVIPGPAMGNISPMST